MVQNDHPGEERDLAQCHAGARRASIVVTKLMPPDRLPMPPTRSPMIQKSAAAPRAERALGERRVGEPAKVGCPAGDEAEVDQHAAEKCHPEAQGVEPRERHVARADLSGTT